MEGQGQKPRAHWGGSLSQMMVASIRAIAMEISAQVNILKLRPEDFLVS